MQKIIFLYVVVFTFTAIAVKVQAQNIQEKIKKAENFAITMNVVEVQKTPAIQYLGTIEEQIKKLENFYETKFGCKMDFSQVEIPEKRKGFGRLVIIAENLSCNEAFAASREHYDCSSPFSDLDGVLIHNDREPNESYAIWVRDSIGSDTELQGEPVINLKENKTNNGITLLERLVWELLYFNETGKHLFLRDWNLCSGSYSDKRMPLVYWNVYHRTLRILWYDPTIIRMDLYTCPVGY